MSYAFFYDPMPQFMDANGDPFAGGRIYFGQPGQDPKTNPKAVYLNSALSAPATNPQPLNTRGIPSEGVLYMPRGEAYSFLLEDAAGNEIRNIPEIMGVGLPVNIDDLDPVVVDDQVTIRGLTSASLFLDSGVTPGAVGQLVFQENGVSQFRVRREAITDGGALKISNLSGGVFDEIELPLAGGFILRRQGVVLLQSDAAGLKVLGNILGSKQVPICYGTFTNAGLPVGDTFGIDSAGPVTGSPTGEYEVLLTETVSSELNLNVLVLAENGSDIPMLARGRGGAGASNKALIFTYDGVTAAAADCAEFTVFVFDAGRS